MSSRVELDVQRVRAAKNQSLFREVNERIEHLANGSLASFICECMQATCDERLQLTLDQYEKIRADSNRFVVLAGHDVPGVERVVETTDGYVLVEKLGLGGALAERLDPRGRE